MLEINLTKPIMAKPFLKWVGGKTQLLTSIKKFVPDTYGRYYEPFTGGGALFFALEPKRATINDLNSHLTDLYKDVRDDVDRLLIELKNIETEYIKLNHEDRRAYFYEKRNIYNILGSSLTKSALLIFINRTCFNGMYRENPNHEFNVPFGKNNHKVLFDDSVLRKASKALSGTVITNGSYESILNDATTDDFIYLDPPYVPLTETASFTSYTGKDFGLNEHEELRNVVATLSDRGCYVVLSNSNTKTVRELYKNFNLNEVQASRAVNCKAHGRGKITELLIANDRAQKLMVLEH